MALINVLLWRCHTCGTLITCEEVKRGDLCPKCSGIHRRLAVTLTWKEQIRIFFLILIGKVKIESVI